MGSEFLSRNRRSNNTSQSSASTASRIPQTRYCHNPYSQLQSFSVVTSGPASQETLNREVAKKVLPQGTLRVDLSGKVPFFAFPEHVNDRTRQRSEAPPLADRADTLRQIFFGQLPYKVSDAMILWLCDNFAESDVLFIERVMQDKSRKGCMQVFVDDDAAEFIITALNKRVLFDRTGVWQASTAEQLQILEEHCNNDMNRFKGFPYRPMVVELATSTYVRRHRPAPASRRSGSATPPPTERADHDSNYNESVVGEEQLPEYPYPPMYDAEAAANYAAVPPPPMYYDSEEPQYLQGGESPHDAYLIPIEGPYRSYIPSYDEAVHNYDAPPQYAPQYDACPCPPYHYDAHCGIY